MRSFIQRRQVMNPDAVYQCNQASLYVLKRFLFFLACTKTTYNLMLFRIVSPSNSRRKLLIQYGHACYFHSSSATSRIMLNRQRNTLLTRQSFLTKLDSSLFVLTRRNFFNPSFSSKSLLKVKNNANEMKSRLSPRAQTGLFAGALGTMLVTIPYAVVYVKENYIDDDDDVKLIDKKTIRPDVYNDIEFVDDDLLSGLSTRVILDYIFDKESTDNEEENVLNKASRFLSEVIYNEQTEEALKKLVLSVLKSDEVLNELQHLAKKLFTNLFQDEETLQQVIELLRNALAHEKIKEGLRNLALDLIQDETIFKQLLGLISRITDDESVKNALADVMKNATHQTLDDDGVMQHTKEFAANLVGDSTIQRTGGDALWNTIGYSISPSFSTTIVITFMGICSLAIGMFALSMSTDANLPSEQALEKVMDRASNISGGSLFAAIFSPFATFFKAIVNAPSLMQQKLASGISFTLHAVTRYISTSMTSIQRYIGYCMKQTNDSLRYSAVFILNWTISELREFKSWTLEISKSSLILIGGYTINCIINTKQIIVSNISFLIERSMTSVRLLSGNVLERILRKRKKNSTATP